MASAAARAASSRVTPSPSSVSRPRCDARRHATTAPANATRMAWESADPLARYRTFEELSIDLPHPMSDLPVRLRRHRGPAGVAGVRGPRRGRLQRAAQARRRPALGGPLARISRARGRHLRRPGIRPRQARRGPGMRARSRGDRGGDPGAPSRGGGAPDYKTCARCRRRTTNQTAWRCRRCRSTSRRPRSSRTSLSAS